MHEERRSRGHREYEWDCGAERRRTETKGERVWARETWHVGSSPVRLATPYMLHRRISDVHGWGLACLPRGDDFRELGDGRRDMTSVERRPTLDLVTSGL